MKNCRRPLFAFVSLCVCFGAPSAAGAQGRFTTAAEAVARQVITEMDAMRWSRAAALFHPASAERLKATQLRMARVMEQARQAPAHSYRDPAMPAEASRWMDRQDSIARTRMPSTLLAMQLAGVASAGQLDSLPAVEVVARWLEARDDRDATLSRAIAAANPSAQREPVEPPRRVRTVLGGISENDSTTQVLIRTRMVKSLVPDPGSLSVMTLRRSPQGWRVWTLDGGEGWMGSPRFAMGSDLGPQLGQQLDARRDSTLTWRDAAGTTVRAAVLGYPGGGRPPRSALVEVRAPDGALHTVEIPYGALTDLLGYLTPWITIPAMMQGRSPY